MWRSRRDSHFDLSASLDRIAMEDLPTTTNSAPAIPFSTTNPQNSPQPEGDPWKRSVLSEDKGWGRGDVVESCGCTRKTFEWIAKGRNVGNCQHPLLKQKALT